MVAHCAWAVERGAAASRKTGLTSSGAAAYEPTRPGHFVAATRPRAVTARDTSSYAVAKNEPVSE